MIDSNKIKTESDQKKSKLISDKTKTNINKEMKSKKSTPKKSTKTTKTLKKSK